MFLSVVCFGVGVTARQRAERAKQIQRRQDL
jgi:hypothetical protein